MAVGSIGGAILSSSAQKKAASTAAAAQQTATDSQLQLGRENIAFQTGIYNQNKALLSPFVSRGNDAGNSINALLGLGGQSAQPAPAANTNGYQTNPVAAQEPLNAMNGYGGGGYGPAGDGARFMQDNGVDSIYDGPRGANFAARFPQGMPQQQTAQVPQAAQPAQPAAANGASATDAFNNFANSAGMQFQLQQGTNAIASNRAAHGGFQSGAALKALQNYGQNTALNNYFLPYMGLLQGQQAVGAQSGSAIAGVGSNFGNTVSNIYGQQGNAIQNGADATSNAALLRGQANANMWNSVGGAVGGFASSFFPSGSSGGGSSRGYY